MILLPKDRFVKGVEGGILRLTILEPRSVTNIARLHETSQIQCKIAVLVDLS
jgi:hypothetical protein